MPRVRTAVIPAAGIGSRMLPASKAVPKEMFPIVDRPVIQYVVDDVLRSGIDHIVIVTGRTKRAIEDHFDYDRDLDQRLRSAGRVELADSMQRISDSARFTFVRQSEPRGNGHAVLCASAAVGNEPFLMLWGDFIVDSDPPAAIDLVAMHERSGESVCAVMGVPPSDVPRYGILDADPIGPGAYRVVQIVEKPRIGQAPSSLASMYGAVFHPDIFSILARTAPGANGEIWLTDAMNALASDGRLYAQEITGRRYDAGDQLEILKASVDFALRRADIGPAFMEYLKQVVRTPTPV